MSGSTSCVMRAANPRNRSSRAESVLRARPLLRRAPLAMSPGAGPMTLPRAEPARQAPPMRRARDRLAFEARDHFLIALLERFPARERARLIGCPRAQLGLARASGEIGIGNVVRDAVDPSFNVNLTT